MLIQDGITIDDNQRAVVEKWDFEITIGSNNHYKLVDPIIRKALPKSNKKLGIYTGGNLDSLLTKAIEARKVRDAALTNNSNDDVAPPPTLPGLKGTKQKKKPESTSRGKTVAEAVAESPAIDPDEEPPEETAIVQPPVIDTPLEITGAELDDTGKRVKPTKKEPKPKKVNRYLRSARVIVENFDITPEELTVAANMSISTATHMLEAFTAVTSYLAATGALKVPGRKIEPATGKGIHFRAREHIAANPDIAPKELSKLCERMTPDTASQCIMGFNSISQVLAEKKWLK